MAHVLGIDAGGTKTVCLLADDTGQVIAEARGAGANLQTVGELGVEKVLHTVMEEAMAEHPVSPVAICLGMAGVDRPEERRVVQSIMRRIGYKSRALIVNDALIALVAGVGDQPGVVLVAGTGSIAYGRNAANQAARAGGWGHVVGDEGSGYWIGREALRAALRDADGRGPATTLTAQLVAHFGVSQPSGLVRVIYDRNLQPRAVATVAVCVQEAADAGDVVARGILEDAATELVIAARSVITRLGLASDAFPCLLAGGMYRAVPFLAAALSRRVPEGAPLADVRELKVDPALGAVHLAIEEACGTVRLPVYI
jgi:N-acetylglucosamine kinase-like BadF-type ATPase